MPESFSLKTLETRRSRRYLADPYGARYYLSLPPLPSRLPPSTPLPSSLYPSIMVTRCGPPILLLPLLAKSRPLPVPPSGVWRFARTRASLRQFATPTGVVSADYDIGHFLHVGDSGGVGGGWPCTSVNDETRVWSSKANGATAGERPAIEPGNPYCPTRVKRTLLLLPRVVSHVVPLAPNPPRRLPSLLALASPPAPRSPPFLM